MATVTRHHLLAAMRAGKAFDGAAFARGGDGLVAFAPPVLQASFEMPGARSGDDRRVIEAFEQRADAARDHMLSPPQTFSLPTLTPAELLAAIAIATAEIEALPPSRRAARRMAMRGGLQIIGVCITDGAGPSDSSSPFRLSNAHLPFSLRLIGCVVMTPLAMSNCELVTLDLSGSALTGLDASFLKATGSVRLRRCYLQAPADFGGARIHGYFDATDLTLKPFGTCPANQAFDGDRGMLNLSQATIDNDIRLERAIIWGGFAMRGLKTQRSVFLNEAVILSPLAVLEAMAVLELIAQGSGNAVEWQPGQSPETLCWFPTLARPPAYASARRRLARRNCLQGTGAFTQGGTARWQASVLHNVLTDTLRVRTSAVRADGVHIGGSVFARSIVCHGRMRLKYATIAGGLSLEGSRLRSNEAIRRMFDDFAPEGIALPGFSAGAVAIGRYRTDTYELMVHPDDLASDSIAKGGDDFVLDIRESRIGGTVRIGPSTDDFRHATDTTSVNGVIAADRVRVEGEMRFTNVSFHWAVRINAQHPDPARSYRPARASQSRKAAVCRNYHHRKLKTGKRHAIRLGNSSIADDVTFDGASGLNGVDFGNANIKGDVSFFARIEVANSARTAACILELPAALGIGQIKLAGAEIAGDCRLLFDRDVGPSIVAEHARIGGEIEIATATGPSARMTGRGVIVALDPETFDRDVVESDRAWRRAQAKAGMGLPAWQDWVGKQRNRPKIDLRNAHATSFGHFPPAWPHTGRLEITGFRYERTKGHGPLAPHPGKIAVREHRSDGWIMLGITILTGLFCWHLALQPIQENLGEGIYWLAVLVTIAVIDVWLPIGWAPLRSQSRPMAIPYLNLQRLELSRHRSNKSITSRFRFFVAIILAPLSLTIMVLLRALGKAEALLTGYTRPATGNRSSWKQRFIEKIARPLWRVFTGRISPSSPKNHIQRFKDRLPKPQGNVYHALEPYVVAAKALREEGRWLSGNLVEERRLHVRTGQLSWRLHLFAKASFNLAHFAVRYGFSYVRLGYMTVALVLIAGMLGQHGINSGAIVPDSTKVDFAATLGSAFPGGARPFEQVDPRACRGKITERCIRFSALAYGIDAVIPTVSMGEMDKWEFKPKKPGPFAPASEKPDYKTLILSLRIIGFALVGLLIVGITSRLGTLIGRYRD